MIKHIVSSATSKHVSLAVYRQYVRDERHMTLFNQWSISLLVTLSHNYLSSCRVDSNNGVGVIIDGIATLCQGTESIQHWIWCDTVVCGREVSWHHINVIVWNIATSSQPSTSSMPALTNEAFTSLISSHLISSHLILSHFTWTECNVEQHRSPWLLPFRSKQSHCLVWLAIATANCVTSQCTQLRWNEVRRDKVTWVTYTLRAQ